MQVLELKLESFRNLKQVSIKFNQTVLISGSNAQGKSNLLESIYFLATSKSPRVSKDFQLISSGQSVLRAEGLIKSDSKEEIKLEITLVANGEDPELGTEKRVKVNGLGKRLLDYSSNLVVVYFSPEDINLIGGSPSLRRIYLDLFLSQSDKVYKKSLSNYMIALTSRNKVLKTIREGMGSISELEYWDLQLIEHGGLISSKRKDYFDFLNQNSVKLNTETGSFGKLEFKFTQSLVSHERLLEYQPREVASAMSLIGPHRDDFSFLLDNENLAFFGSRGQQRMAILDLKLLELQFIEENFKVVPVLLLDDIFSELDEKRREFVSSVIKNYQTILTAVDIETIPQELLDSAQKIKVKEGILTKA